MKKNRAFTLIEMMVVLFVIGILSTVTMLSVNAPNFTRFLTKAELIGQTFSVLSDDAIYSSALIACNIHRENVSCRKYRDGEWADLNMKRVINWNWPDGVFVKQILVNSQPLKEKDTVNFDPSGDNDVLAVEVSDGVYSVWIYGDLTGRYWVSS